MIIKETEIIYLPGSKSYNDGIRGPKNYEHIEYVDGGRKGYDGVGRVCKNRPAKLVLYGLDENNNEIGPVNIKEDILKIFERQRLSESFVKELTDGLPDNSELGTDEFGKYILKEKSLQLVHGAKHPRKTKKKYGQNTK